MIWLFLSMTTDAHWEIRIFCNIWDTLKSKCSLTIITIIWYTVWYTVKKEMQTWVITNMSLSYTHTLLRLLRDNSGTIECKGIILLWFFRSLTSSKQVEEYSCTVCSKPSVHKRGGRVWSGCRWVSGGIYDKSKKEDLQDGSDGMEVMETGGGAGDMFSLWVTRTDEVRVRGQVKDFGSKVGEEKFSWFRRDIPVHLCLYTVAPTHSNPIL